MASTSSSVINLSSLPNFNGTTSSRLQSLYSDISRQKHSNPTSYQSNVSWWRVTLEAIVAKGWQLNTSDKLVLHADQTLPESLRFERTGKPLCLGTVIAELNSAKALISLPQFIHAAQSVYDPGWLPLRIASYVLGKPLLWALQQLNIVGTDEGGHEGDAERWKRVKGDYVVLGLAERAAEAVLEKQRTRTSVSLSLADTLYTFDSFRAEFADSTLEEVTLSDTDLRVLIKFLERDKRVVIVDKEVIKFVEADTSRSSEVSPVDRGVLELKTAVSSLDAQVENIQNKIDACTDKVTAALRQKRKEVALSYIRSRKQLENLLRQRLGSLETLHSTLIRVEAAAGDIEIMKSYESSTATLRTLLAHPSLQRESMDKTFDALAAATADARDVDDSIRIGGEIARTEAGVEVGDEELEEELARLVEEGERERMEKLEGEKLEKMHLERERAARQEEVKQLVEKAPVLEAV
ncbi:hypothetical protein EW146_g3303 [Bondarzewia mesenterica]|uniref:Snf7-domain-containing protein n=1 Tax=Bondarzewia mesenterica TaxID=1095465 RepID=A0A4S4LY01_9AGAM|nr:hypothetical protein EW146_g3303 [Bondarzewia mesenterica]